MIPAQKVFNSKGEEIKLVGREIRIANSLQRQANDLGYDINITTLTSIIKKVSEQKFYEIPPAEYLPVVVGEGAWSDQMVAYRSFNVGDQFETGIIDVGAENSRLASGDAGVDSVSIPILNWAKQVNWSIPNLEMAAKSGNWNLVEAKEESRKKNWDLGIQRVAFLGVRNSTIPGLYSLSGVTYNTTTLTAAISSLTTDNLKTFCATVLNDYRSNCYRTAWPTHFVIPESDFLGLAAPASSTYPIRSTLSLLEETFQVMTKNKSFKILPNAYGDKANSGFSYQQYVLLNYDEKSIRMNIPVDYTTTLANSLNNFQFQNVGYGQFTGVQVIRPAEVLYYKF